MFSSQDLGSLLHRSSHLTRQRMDARLQRFGATPVQAHIILFLSCRANQTVTQRELERFLRVRPSTVNGLVDRLEEKGLLVRTVSSNDARSKVLRLTEAGRQQQKNLESGIRETEQIMSSGFSEEELAQLRALLGRVIENLEKDGVSC